MNEILHVPEEGYKRGGKVKGKKKAKGKAKRKITAKAKAKRMKKEAPSLTTMGIGQGSYQATMGIGQGSYQATIQPSGGAFQAPSYFRAVGSSDNYASVPPVLREFVKQQEKIWEDLKKGKATVDGSVMGDVANATPVTTTKPVKMSRQERLDNQKLLKKKVESDDVVGGGGLPYAFAPASGNVMKPLNAMIDSPSSSYAPLLASQPDDLSQSASASSVVASSAMASSGSSKEEEDEEDEEGEAGVEAGIAPPSQEQQYEAEAQSIAKSFLKQNIKSAERLYSSITYDKARVETIASDLGLRLPSYYNGKRVRRWKDIGKGGISELIFQRIQAYIPSLPAQPSSAPSSSSSSGAF